MKSSPEPQILLAGLAFPESPRWHRGRLWVSDWGAREIIAIDPGGKSVVVVRVDFQAFPMCMDWLPDERLLVTGPGLLRSEPDGSFVPHADLSGISRYRWNEIVVDGRGNIYVNGGGFDFGSGEEFKPGLIALVTPDGSARQVADGIAFPNGMAVTPDNSTLIVAESYGNRLTAFDIGSDGNLSNRRVWADVPGDHPDGICLDAENAIWSADVANNHCIRVREGGEMLNEVKIDRGCFACALGGPDGKTLFIVANEWRGLEAAAEASREGQVLTVEAPARGAGWL